MSRLYTPREILPPGVDTSVISCPANILLVQACRCWQVDVFINSEYVYNNRIIVLYNINGEKQVSHIDMQDTGFQLSDPKPDGSDKNGHGTAVYNRKLQKSGAATFLMPVRVILFPSP